jgi:hypothetical protein
VPTLIGVGAFVMLCCGGTLVVGLAGGDKTTDVTSATSAAPAAEDAAPAPEAAAPTTSTAVAEPTKAAEKPEPTKSKAPGIGDKVRGGDFEFTVKSVKCVFSRVC